MAESDENTTKGALSFGFSKKLENKKLKQSVVGELDQKSEETDFVYSLEGKEVKSSKPQTSEKKTWVIPLIKENNWRSSSESKENKQEDRGSITRERKENDNVQPEGDDLNDQAAKEIIEAAALQNESWTTRGEPDPSLSVPLLMRNKVPEGFETDDRLDVSLRPDGPVDVDYEQIPIDQFGFAMLRGMGWKDGEGIGKNKDLVAPLEAVLRPKGLGLGADRSLLLQKKNGTVSHMSKDEECLVLKRGAFCLVVKGKDKDLYGVVEGLDEDNARVVIKLTLSGKSITLSQYSVELVSKKDYEKFSKYLNKGKVDKFKEEQEKKNERKRRSKSRSSSPHEKSRKKRSHHDRSSSPDSGSKKSKRDRSISPRDRNRYKDDYNARDSHQERKPKEKDRSDKYDSDRSKYSNGEPSEKKIKKEKYDTSQKSSSNYLWVRANIKVRIVDKNYKNGKYYKAKVIIVDVVSHDNCICRTENGKVLEGLSQNVLETVIPKDDNPCVFIVGGKHRGQMGQVVKKSKETSQALVQLLSDRDTVLKLSYDDVCEYVGSIDDEFDY